MISADPVQQRPPASLRNGPLILAVLERILAPVRAGGLVLEIAAGSGYHAALFAKALPRLMWQPTDASPEALASIASYGAEANLANFNPPLALDVCSVTWPVDAADGIVCINMIHISPWAATLGLFDGAARLLSAGSPLITYGPYSVNGDFLADSNVAFDQSLRARNVEWGIRDVTDVVRGAAERGFARVETVSMPANNLTLVFRKQN